MAKLKLDEALIANAVKHIKAGNYVNVVVQYLGIDESTFYIWMQKAEAELKAAKEAEEGAEEGAETVPGEASIYVKFYKSIKEAEAEAELRNVTIIQQAATTTWQAAAWYLERKHFYKWGNKKLTEITGKDGEPVKIEEKIIPPDIKDKRVKKAFDALYEITDEEEENDDL